MDEVSIKDSVYSVTNRILMKLGNMLNTPSGKTNLANLRNSVGKPLSETINIWPIIFEQIPVEFLGNGRRITCEENAILTTLQLYALHQQGIADNIFTIEKEDGWGNIGSSLKVLRKTDNSVAIDRRFNAMITATTYEELIHHLRQMIKLLKARQKTKKINYALLSQDLHWFLRGYEENLRLNWARAYYQTDMKEINNEK